MKYVKGFCVKRQHTMVLVTMALLLTLVACSGSATKNTAPAPGDTLTTHARLLTIIDRHTHLDVTIADPWHEGKTLARYYLVNKDSATLDAPEGVSIITTPVTSMAVFSSVHTAPLEELDHGDLITAVADADYFTSPFIRKGLKQGTIADVGNSMSPSLERLVDISPQIMLVSPFEKSDHSAIERAGITVVPMADYMEATPLGRAEWILLIGALCDDLPAAREIYRKVTTDYTALCQKVTVTSERPLVITDLPYSGTWSQPAGGSYAARMLNDAGARVIYADDTSTGSVQSDYATIYDKGHDAPYWLIRSFGTMTRRDLAAANPLNADFNAYRRDAVYYTDTSTSGIFDIIAFHPERVLKDYVKILHPELIDTPLQFYRHMR